MSDSHQRPASRDAYVVFDIGFGDGGKGTVTDALVRRFGAKTVVRYNGGPQAGHNVVTADGIWHCSAQFGAGTLAGAGTSLSPQMPIELEALVAEAEALQKKGISDPLHWMTLDTRSLVITPGHKLVGQVREILRGEGRFGSCGMGVGEALLDAEKGLAITIGDLLDPVSGLQKLESLLAAKLAEAEALPGVRENADARERMKYFRGRMQAPSLYETYAGILTRLEDRLDVDGGRFKNILASDDALVFEGAQGALLDREGGFAPYVTKSRATWHNAQALLSGSGRHIKKVGVLRAYGHRHGSGPFVTEDSRLLSALNDPRNPTNRWQGDFRVGRLDLVALRYGLSLNDGADQLALTHLDRLSGLGRIRVCTAYVYDGDERDLGDRFVWTRKNGEIVITAIVSSASAPGLPSVADILFSCWPYEQKILGGWDSISPHAKELSDLPQTAQNFVRWLEGSDGLNTPIGILSLGPRSDQKLFLQD